MFDSRLHLWAWYVRRRFVQTTEQKRKQKTKRGLTPPSSSLVRRSSVFATRRCCMAFLLSKFMSCVLVTLFIIFHALVLVPLSIVFDALKFFGTSSPSRAPSSSTARASSGARSSVFDAAITTSRATSSSRSPSSFASSSSRASSASTARGSSAARSSASWSRPGGRCSSKRASLWRRTRTSPSSSSSSRCSRVATRCASTADAKRAPPHARALTPTRPTRAAQAHQWDHHEWAERDSNLLFGLSMEQILGDAPALSFEELLRPANLAHARALVEPILDPDRVPVSWERVADGKDYPKLTIAPFRALRNRLPAASEGPAGTDRRGGTERVHQVPRLLRRPLRSARATTRSASSKGSHAPQKPKRKRCENDEEGAPALDVDSLKVADLKKLEARDTVPKKLKKDLQAQLKEAIEAAAAADAAAAAAAAVAAERVRRGQGEVQEGQEGVRRQVCGDC